MPLPDTWATVHIDRSERIHRWSLFLAEEPGVHPRKAYELIQGPFDTDLDCWHLVASAALRAHRDAV